MTIAIVGPPASGKSTVGRALAKRLGRTFIDVDAEIERRTGHTIPEIFVDQGEPAFRALEREATIEFLKSDAIVSLGGGAVLNADIRAALKGHDVIWLQVSVVHATRRVGMNVMRPLLLGDVRANMQKLLTEREPFYREVATLTVDSGTRRPEAIVTHIISELGLQTPEVGEPTSGEGN